MSFGQSKRPAGGGVKHRQRMEGRGEASRSGALSAWSHSPLPWHVGGACKRGAVPIRPARPAHPVKKSQAIHRALLKAMSGGPLSTLQLAAALGESRGEVGIHLRIMLALGQVACERSRGVLVWVLPTAPAMDELAPAAPAVCLQHEVEDILQRRGSSTASEIAALLPHRARSSVSMCLARLIKQGHVVIGVARWPLRYALVTAAHGAQA